MSPYGMIAGEVNFYVGGNAGLRGILMVMRPNFAISVFPPDFLQNTVQVVLLKWRLVCVSFCLSS